MEETLSQRTTLTKKPKRVSARKELAVVTLAAVASILEETEQALSRFRKNSDLSVLNREGRLRLDTLSRDGHPLADRRLLAAIRAATDAYEWSQGMLDPRVIDSLPWVVARAAGFVAFLSATGRYSWAPVDRHASPLEACPPGSTHCTEPWG